MNNLKVNDLKNDWVDLLLFFKENPFSFKKFKEKIKEVKSISFESEEEAFFVFIWAFERIYSGIFVGDEPINACKKRFKTKSSTSMYKRMARLISIRNAAGYCVQRDSLKTEIKQNQSLMDIGKGARLLEILENL